MTVTCAEEGGDSDGSLLAVLERVDPTEIIELKTEVIKLVARAVTTPAQS